MKRGNSNTKKAQSTLLQTWGYSGNEQKEAQKNSTKQRGNTTSIAGGSSGPSYKSKEVTTHGKKPTETSPGNFLAIFTLIRSKLVYIL